MITEKLIKKFWNTVAEKDAARIAVTAEPEGITVISDIPYIDDGDKFHMLDVYYPEGTSSALPVLMDIHGGGWMHGTKELNKNFCMWLAGQGFTVLSISYRLCPSVTVYDQIKDCFAALGAARGIASKHFGDADNFFLAGDSAGGHLAALVTLINRSDKLAKQFGVTRADVDVRALGLICPVLDVQKFLDKRLPIVNTYFKIVAGKDYRKDPMSRMLSVKALLPCATLPPVFFMTGEEDIFKFASRPFIHDVVDTAQTNIIHDFPKGVEHKLEHVFNVLYPYYPESIAVNTEMCDFFKSNMKAK